MHFTFTNEYKASRLDEIVSYLAGPRLWVPQTDYPDYFYWLEKVHHQLKHETKRAIIALSRGIVSGVIIYQKHAALEKCLEYKNITVRPDLQGRYIASFLLRNAEIEGGSEYGATKAIVDAKAHNLPVRSFLLSHKYSPLDTTDLYGLSGGKDVVFMKHLRGHTAG